MKMDWMKEEEKKEANSDITRMALSREHTSANKTPHTKPVSPGVARPNLSITITYLNANANANVT